MVRDWPGVVFEEDDVTRVMQIRFESKLPDHLDYGGNVGTDEILGLQNAIVRAARREKQTNLQIH